jgi:hypothetical protein
MATELAGGHIYDVLTSYMEIVSCPPELYLPARKAMLASDLASSRNPNLTQILDWPFHPDPETDTILSKALAQGIGGLILYKHNYCQLHGLIAANWNGNLSILVINNRGITLDIFNTVTNPPTCNAESNPILVLNDLIAALPT